MTGPAPPNAPVPPRPDKPASGWQDYEPRPTDSSPARESRRARRMHLVVGTVIAFVIVVAVVAGITVSRHLSSRGSGNCSPNPCADDGSGFQVYVDSINRNLSVSQVDQPANGNHIVQITVRFKNMAGVTRSADPLDFTLRDATGREHRLLLNVGAQCGVFEAVNLASGSTIGPAVMCFEAIGNSQSELTLLWSPETRQIAIGIP